MAVYKLTKDVSELKEIARKIRVDLLKMLHKAGSGHTGGSLSSAEIFACLYFSVMKHDPQSPKWDGRDKFVLSKGHGCPTLYVSLATTGYFDKKHLDTLRKVGSILQGHPAVGKTPGVEVSTGSLGHGLPMAVGMGIAAKLDKKDTRTYVLLGDGEIQEGEVWEGAMSAAHYKLDNICAILDHNGLQIDGTNEEVMTVMPVVEKWQAFGWNVISADGHCIESLLKAFDSAAATKGKPSIIIAKTIKGKGVSFFENVVDYHGVTPKDDELKRALKELGEDA